MKKQKIGAFITCCLMGLVTGACNSDVKEENTDSKAKTESLQIQRKAERSVQAKSRQKEQEEHNFKNRVVDSVLVAKRFPKCGYHKKINELNDSIRALKYKNSPRFAMETAVFNSGKSIAKCYTNILAEKLGFYGLFIDKNAIKEYFFKTDFIMFGAYRDAEMDCYYYEQCVINDAVEYVKKYLDFGNTNYGEKRKQEIVAMIKNIVVEMCNKMHLGRKATEAKFAQYFPGGMKTINMGCVTETNDGDEHPRYADYYLDKQMLVTNKTVRLYDSKLPVDFFMDKSAKYSVEKVGSGKWRIVKKTKDGEVYKTKTFAHDTDYMICSFWVNEMGPDCNYFRATPGDNIGVHIESRETVKIEKAKTVFRGSPETDRQIRELEVERQELENRKDEYVVAQAYADSLANEMWKKKSQQVR